MSSAVFPTLIGLGWNMTWEPNFSTLIKTAVSGKEYRIQRMANPIYEFGLSYNLLRHGPSQELRNVYGFFLARGGSFDNFYYLNPDDNSVTDQFIGQANSTNRNFQLMRSFGSEFIEPVQNIISVANVKVNGSLKALGADYTVTSGGIVVFNVAPNTGPVTWSGSYYYRCRFTDDKLTFNKFMRNFWELKKLNLTGCLGTKI